MQRIRRFFRVPVLVSFFFLGASIALLGCTHERCTTPFFDALVWGVIMLFIGGASTTHPDPPFWLRLRYGCSAAIGACIPFLVLGFFFLFTS